MTTERKIIYSMISVLLVYAGLEIAVRVLRPQAPSEPAPDAVSVLPFQRMQADYLVPVTVGGRNYWTMQHVDLPSDLVLRDKPTDALRVILLGGSQAGAMGLSDSAGYARRLERFLAARYPGRNVEIINLAATGYAAAQHAELAAKVVARLRPDVVLGVFGHNERLDVKALAAEGKTPPALLEVSRALQRHSRLARLLRPKPRPAAEPGRPLPSWRLDPAWNSYWIARFERAIDSLAQTAETAGAKLVLALSPSNLQYVGVRDWWWLGDRADDLRVVEARYWLTHGQPARAVELLQGFAGEEKSEAGQRAASAKLALGLALVAAGREAEAATLLGEASELAWGHLAGPHEWPLGPAALTAERFGRVEELARIIEGRLNGPEKQNHRPAVLGWALVKLGLVAQGRAILATARDDDAAGIRADAAVATAMQLAAERIGATFVDLDEPFQQTCSDDLCGYGEFIDYCHLTPGGHLRLAGLLIPVVEEALGLDGSAENPAARAEVKLAAELAGRERDFPEYAEWLGVCDEMWQLSDERLDDAPCMGPFAADDPVAQCFAGNHELGNMRTAEKMAEAAAAYRRALAIDPDFGPALTNLVAVESVLENK
jgi:lysophospholipase L1-like esterase